MNNQTIYKSLLNHEKNLLDKDELENITHIGSTSVWLQGSLSVPKVNYVNVYRPMGDIEVIYLFENNLLPLTQPYQAIIEGET